MQILSKATERFLEPIDPNRLKGAILRVSLKPKTADTAPIKSAANKDAEHGVDSSNVKSFILEIYDLNESGMEISPESYTALSFVRKRFKHGYRVMSHAGKYHESYEVPATDYSLYLILHTWTGKRVISQDASVL